MDLGNTAPLAITLTGLVLGMRHASDPDHVVAVTTILSRERSFGAALRIGMVWGLGHTLTVLAVGVAIIVFKLAIPARLGLAMELAVAVVLILLGLGTTTGLIRRLFARTTREAATASEAAVVHSHPHGHQGMIHRHPHVHAHPHEPAGGDGIAADDFHRDHGISTDLALSDGLATKFAAQRPLIRSFAVGLVHGLAGSAAIALFVLTAIPEPLWATIYLAVFCVGTIIGMGLITCAIATPFLIARQRTAWLHQGLVTSSGVASFAFGLFLVYQIGFVDRLFGVAPLWTPH